MGLLSRIFGSLSADDHREDRSLDTDHIEGFYVVERKVGTSKARELFRRADAGDVNAVTEIAFYFYDSMENEIAFTWLKKASDMGSADAMVYLSDYYSGRIRGGEVDPEIAEHLLERAIELNSPQAFLKLADEHYSEDDPRENKIAFGYYMQAAELGDPEGQARVGMAYLDGVGAEQNFKEAVRWLSMSTDYRHAAYPLARCFTEGLGTSVDYTKATIYLELAVDAKCMEMDQAREKLIEFYENGYGGSERNAKKAKVKAELEASRKIMRELAATILGA